MPTLIYRRLSIEELTGSVQPVDRFELDPFTYQSRSRLRGNICEALCCQQSYVCPLSRSRSVRSPQRRSDLRWGVLATSTFQLHRFCPIIARFTDDNYEIRQG